MYTRKELGEMALRRILGGARKPEFNLDIREIMIAVDQERDRQVGAYYKRKILAGDRQIEGDVLSNYVIPKASMTEKGDPWSSFILISCAGTVRTQHK